VQFWAFGRVGSSSTLLSHFCTPMEWKRLGPVAFVLYLALVTWTILMFSFFFLGKIDPGGITTFEVDGVVPFPAFLGGACRFLTLELCNRGVILE